MIHNLNLRGSHQVVRDIGGGLPNVIWKGEKLVVEWRIVLYDHST